jgi:undecaprenyl diphosphate synthase
MKDIIEFDRNNIPESIAIIMDGNGRWAQEKGLPRSNGHLQGVDNVTRITSECARLGVKYLTMYTFSTENWNRPEAEVKMLMGLVVDKLEDEIFMKNDIRFRYIGDLERLPAPARQRVLDCMENTKNNKRMTAVTALNYSSRWELTKAMRDAAKEVQDGHIKPEDITEEYISNHLETSFMPDPDLLIRTGGELRIINYLLWQCAYSEFYFCDTYWPDFHEEELYKAIAAYQQRQRRFGMTGEQVTKG